MCVCVCVCVSRNLVTTQLLCPHLFRYYAVCIILLKRRKELQSVLQVLKETDTQHSTDTHTDGRRQHLM